MLPQEIRLLGYGLYRAARHPSAPIGSFLATKGTFGRTYSNVSPTMSMLASMVASARPPPMV
jgi:hypothetical protein